MLKTKFCRSLRAIFGTGKKLRKKRYFFVALLQIKLYEGSNWVFVREKDATTSCAGNALRGAVETNREKLPFKQEIKCRFAL